MCTISDGSYEPHAIPKHIFSKFPTKWHTNLKRDKLEWDVHSVENFPTWLGLCAIFNICIMMYIVERIRVSSIQWSQFVCCSLSSGWATVLSVADKYFSCQTNWAYCLEDILTFPTAEYVDDSGVALNWFPNEMGDQLEIRLRGCQNRYAHI